MLSSLEKEGDSATTCMNLKDLVVSEMNQKQKSKCMIPLTEVLKVVRFRDKVARGNERGQWDVIV